MPTLPLSSYSSLISLTTPFTPPPPPTGPVAAAALNSALSHLLHEYHSSSSHPAIDTTLPHPPHKKLRLLHQLLTLRDPTPPLPEPTRTNIETALLYISTKKPLTSISSLPAINKISLWRGDITSLTSITAIVNAANDRLLGCFTPDHTCIDNVIHAAAGPRLRNDCHTIMTAQGSPEPTGHVKVTRAYLLPARYALHTVAPRIHASQRGVTAAQREELAGCYRACLQALEDLPGTDKSVAFCGVGTGMYRFPPEEAVEVAVETVMAYLKAWPESAVGRVVFNVFTRVDLELYRDKLGSLALLSEVGGLPETRVMPLVGQAAVGWINEAGGILVVAGEGLSLLGECFPGRGVACLRDLLEGAETLDVKWGRVYKYYRFLQAWGPPEGSVYAGLRRLVEGKDWFVRSGDADGVFVRCGFEAGGVRGWGLRCGVCGEGVDAAGVLHGEEWKGAPVCKCGGEMDMWEVGGEGYKGFVERALEEEEEGVRLVVLELGAELEAEVRGVGEGLVEKGKGRVKMVRVGVKGKECVPWEKEGVDMVGVEGDAGAVVGLLLKILGM